MEQTLPVLEVIPGHEHTSSSERAEKDWARKHLGEDEMLFDGPIWRVKKADVFTLLREPYGSLPRVWVVTLRED